MSIVIFKNCYFRFIVDVPRARTMRFRVSVDGLSLVKRDHPIDQLVPVPFSAVCTP